MIRIPTASSFAWKEYGVDWVQLDAPRHLFLHSVNSMKLIAAETGLEVHDIVFDSTHFQFSGSEKYQQDIPLNDQRKKGLFEKIAWKFKKPVLTRRANQLNREGRGDQAAFILRKP